MGMPAKKQKKSMQILAEPLLGAASPTGIRTPVNKNSSPGLHKNLKRYINVQQLAVLLWHLYRVSTDETLGVPDAEVSLKELLNGPLNHIITVKKLDLERLLHAANLCDLSGVFWSPDGKSFKEFVAPLLFNDEVFDRQWNMVADIESGRRIKNKRRFLRRIIKGRK